MSATNRSLLIPTVVSVGSVILVGLPATSLVATVLWTAIEAIGWGGVIESGGSLLVLGVSVLIGFQFAAEIAAVQLGGIDALDRGSPRVALARKVGFATIVVLALGAAAWFAMTATLGGYGPAIGGLGLLVVAAIVLVSYRGRRGFLAGLRSASP